MLLTTRQAPVFLREQTGVGPSPHYLAKVRCTGGGARYLHRGRNVFYDAQTLLEWWLGAMSQEIGSTSEYRPAVKSHLVDLRSGRPHKLLKSLRRKAKDLTATSV